jgi:ABC-type sugar transport system ATPase subunit
MDEPTRGIDVGAKAEMFAVMRGLTRKGLSVIMVSSELEEVLDNADRILVLAKGRQRALLRREEATLARVLNLIFAVEGAAA